LPPPLSALLQMPLPDFLRRPPPQLAAMMPAAAMPPAAFDAIFRDFFAAWLFSAADTPPILYFRLYFDFHCRS